MGDYGAGLLLVRGAGWLWHSNRARRRSVNGSDNRLCAFDHNPERWVERITQHRPGIERLAIRFIGRVDGIEIRTYFHVPLHRMPAFAAVQRAGDLAVTEDLAARTLSLPMANDLSEDAIDAIAATLGAASHNGDFTPL